MSLLMIDDVSVDFGRRRAVDGVSLAIDAGEIVGLIGETGSGKTTLARAVAGLVPTRAGRITLDGTDLTALRGRSLRAFRRSGALQLMFQDPLRALDPQQTVAAIVGEPLVVGAPGVAGAADRVAEALAAVGLDASLSGRRPGEISGGQRQRVLLARAIVTRPRLLIADEPVSALDASNRNHVLRLLDDLRSRTGLAIVVISHDLSSLAGIADRVAVLYGGHLVETGPIADVLGEPAHPYTALLTASAPLVTGTRAISAAALRPAAGRTALLGADAGCPVVERCRFADETCRVRPALTLAPDGRAVACHHADSWRATL